MNKFLANNWFKLGILGLGLIVTLAVTYRLTTDQENTKTEIKDDSAASNNSVEQVNTPISTTTIPVSTASSTPVKSTTKQPATTPKPTPTPIAAEDPAVKIEKCKVKADNDKQTFIQTSEIMEQKVIAESTLMKTRALLLIALYDRPLTASEISQLPASMQSGVQNGDTYYIQTSLQITNDQIKKLQAQMEIEVQKAADALYNDSYLKCLNQ